MGPARSVGVVTTLLLLAGSLFVSASRLLAPSPRPFVLAAAFAPYAVVGYGLVVLLALLLRRGLAGPSRTRLLGAAALALAGLVLHAAWLAPLWLGGHPDGPATLRVMTLNMRLGRADAASAVRLARAEHVDLLVLEEVTPAEGQRLADQGALRTWPHVAGVPQPVSSGTVVLSRFPLGGQHRLQVLNGAVVVHVAAPTPFTLVAAHPVEPLHDAPGWRHDHASLAAATRAALADGPVVLAGDLNTTLDQGPLRHLIGLGLRDAAEESDAGPQPTWPSDPHVAFGLPFGTSLLTLDHVLVSRPYAAVATHTFEVDGTDHRALVVGLTTRR